MKGIVLAGGNGTRLYPITKGVSKQLLPVFDKPAIFYPISVLMLAGIREILIISTPRDLPLIRDLLGNGHELGLQFEYQVQKEPKGIAEALILGEKFIGSDQVSLILGDNLFYGQDLAKTLLAANKNKDNACIFAYHVSNPEQFGVVTFTADGAPKSIVEKPKNPESNWAVTGLYFYPADVSQIAKNLKPSARGELEITDLNRAYLEAGRMRIRRLGRGVGWLDTGTPESLLASSIFVQTLEERQGLKIACLEEISYIQGLITREQLEKLAAKAPASRYGDYLRNLLKFDWVRPGGLKEEP